MSADKASITMATNLLGRKMTTIGSITEMPKEHPDTRIGLGAGKPDRRSSAPHVAARNFGTKELTRVLIVDDHPIVVSGCRALFADNAEIVITEAADAESGLASFVTDPPDVCLIDIDLPSVSGFELVRRISD